jgi:4-hydroxybenzoate polyprenyltransferase
VVSNFLKLVRWPNLVIIAIIFVLLRTQLIEGFHGTTLLRSCLSELHWMLMALATILIAASGNVVNDIFDQDIDAHNRPEDRIVGLRISEENAWTIYYTLSGIGLSLGILLAFLMGNITNGLVFLLALGGLWFYSYSYKRQFLIGNLVVAMLAGLVILLPLIFERMCSPESWMQLPWMPFIMAYAFFSVLSTLIREVIKDMEDMQGDGRMHCSTMPLVIGVAATKAVVSVLTLVLVASVARYQWVKWEENDMLSFFFLVLAVQVPALVMLNTVIKAQHRADYHKASKLAKIMMVGGISSMVLFRIVLG